MPAKSLPKWSAFERSASLPYRRAVRSETTVRETSIAITTATTTNEPPGRVDLVARRSREPRDRERGDGDADEREHSRLRQRREMLGLAVPVLVPFVGRPAGDADREEREQRGDEIRAGVQRLGDQPEAAAREARAELERDEHGRRADRDERRAALRGHARRLDDRLAIDRVREGREPQAPT